jgi:hypothetical protein
MGFPQSDPPRLTWIYVLLLPRLLDFWKPIRGSNKNPKFSEIDAQQQGLPHQESERPVYMSLSRLPSVAGVSLRVHQGFYMRNRHDWSKFVPMKSREPEQKAKGVKAKGGLLPESLFTSIRMQGVSGRATYSQKLSSYVTASLFKHLSPS